MSWPAVFPVWLFPRFGLLLPRRPGIKRRAANSALTELRKMINAGVGAAR